MGAKNLNQIVGHGWSLTCSNTYICSCVNLYSNKKN